MCNSISFLVLIKSIFGTDIKLEAHKKTIGIIGVGAIGLETAKIAKRADVEDTINLGTIGYAAPEQYGSLGQSDEQTDIYCFGMTVLQMLSGANLRDSDALSVLKNRGLRKVTPELFDVIEGCIKADRKLRYKSFREVDDRLKSIPKKRTLRKCMTLVNGFMITAITTLVTTSIIVYAKPIKDAAAYDLDKRLPYVQQRLYIARERLEQYMTVIFTEERE